MRGRKRIPDRMRLEVLKRDKFTCVNCGRSPSKYPELDIDVVRLELDHVVPFSKGGKDTIDNFRTLCRECNAGKGNVETLNQTVEDKIETLLNQINPSILTAIGISGNAKVVANDSEFVELSRLIGLNGKYTVTVIPNTIIGYHAGFNMGIYTVIDNHAGKVNFVIKQAQ